MRCKESISTRSIFRYYGLYDGRWQVARHTEKVWKKGNCLKRYDCTVFEVGGERKFCGRFIHEMRRSLITGSVYVLLRLEISFITLNGFILFSSVLLFIYFQFSRFLTCAL